MMKIAELDAGDLQGKIILSAFQPEIKIILPIFPRVTSFDEEPLLSDMASITTATFIYYTRLSKYRYVYKLKEINK